MLDESGLIEFNFDDTSIQLRNRHALRIFLSKLINLEGKSLNFLSFTFLTDKGLLRMNKKYLNHAEFTDIITFDLNNKKGLITGDIYLSADRIKENAMINKVSQQKEVHRVMFHGVLHLLGYKDQTANDKMVMRERENHYLEMYFVPRGTIQ